MRLPRFSRIYFQFLLPITFIAVTPLLVLGIGIANMDKRTMVQQSERELSSLAGIVRNELQNTLDDLLWDSILAASLPGIVSMDKEQQADILGQLFLHDNRLSFIDILSPDNQLNASSHPNRQPLEKDDAFENAQGGIQSWSLKREAFNDHTYFVIYTPIRANDRKTEGIMAVYIDLLDLVGIVEKVRAGQSRAIVVDSGGQIILHPNRDLVLKGGTGPWQRSLLSKDLVGNGTISYPIDNQKYDVGFAELVDFNWIVLIERPDSELITPAQKAYTFILIAVFLTTFMVLAALLWLANRLTRPIRELAVVSREFASGNSNMPLPRHYSRLDEVGSLICAFGEMRETLVNKTRELQVSEEKYRTLFETVGDAIFIFDPETFEILEANEATVKLYGYSREELIGMSCLQFSAEVEKSKIIEEKMEEEGQAEVPIRHHRDKNGNDIYVQLSGYKTTVRGQEVMFSVCRDITPTLKAEKEKEHLREQLFQSQKMESIGKLAGGIAHDYNNQLTGIMGYADLIQPGLDDETILTYAAKIRKGAQNGAKLTHQLLSFARKGNFSQERINLNDILDEVKGILTHTIDRRIYIEDTRNIVSPTIKGDPHQIQNAILNIALNARDAITGIGHITFKTDLVDRKENTADSPLNLKPGRYISLSIKDDGSGMDESVKKNIFEPFFTTKKMGKGTGMGLSAAFGTVKHHGGDIFVESTPGSGSNFHIFLPLFEKENNNGLS
jgi:PAS domain S-box-containing protein